MQTPQPARSVLSLLGLLALAVVLGVATAFALAGIAMLLAAPAYASGNEVPGYLMLRGPKGEHAAALVSTEVAFRVAGAAARARVVQTFQNPHDDWCEGVYVIPLPENGAVDRLQLVIGGRVAESEIRERGPARPASAFVQTRLAGRRTALLDPEQSNLFMTRVANIGPRDTVVVELEYLQLLRHESPRRIAASPPREPPQNAMGSPFALLSGILALLLVCVALWARRRLG